MKRARDPSLMILMLWLMLFAALFFGGISFSAWVSFAAPRNDLGWVTIKELPARCLPGNR